VDCWNRVLNKPSALHVCGTGVRGLTRGLATSRCIQEPFMVRQGWKTPKRCTACVCSATALLGDLLGISRSVECDSLLSHPRFFCSVIILCRLF